jgi:photosystem II stability/assembly factor-like uncharacterized protein
VGICKKGTRTCNKAGQWDECRNQILPATEQCNGRDDDCNGQIDDNLTAPLCEKQQGVCQGSTKLCGGESGWLPCDDARYLAHNKNYEPIETNCDNLDNDCNGLIDQNIKQPCYSGQSGCIKTAQGFDCKGNCKAGEQICTAGQWGTCQGEILPQPETCNGQDNDCNGTIDDGCKCNPGESAECYSGALNTKGKGVCKAGTMLCTSSGQWGPCTGEVTPQQETCNGLDDDCNGQIDDSLLGPPCALSFGVCAGLRKTCGSTKGWLECTEQDYKKHSAAFEPVETLCDGLDNDCNGQIDENLSRPCYSGNDGCTKQANGTYKCIGACRAGKQTCSNGSWSVCVGEVLPKPEICDNGIDDNCNGQIDECAECTTGQTRPCYTASSGCTQSGNSYQCKGRCKAGIQTCRNSQWPTTCEGEAGPIPEQCNWQDDDCDGTIDNNGACLYSTWRSLSLPVGASKVAFINEREGVAIGPGSSIWRTENGGTSWQAVANSLTHRLNGLAAATQSVVLIVGDAGTVLRSVDGGRSFTKSPTLTTASLLAVDILEINATSGFSAIVVGAGGVILGSRDGGSSFTASTSGTGQTLNAVRFRSSGGHVLAVGNGGTIVRSINFGSTWSVTNSGVSASLYSVAWAGSAAVAVGAGGTISRSTNLGGTWASVPFADSEDLLNVLSPGDGIFVISAQADYLYLSIDDGASFYKRNYGVSGTFSQIALRTPSALMAIHSGRAAIGEGTMRLLHTRPAKTSFRNIRSNNNYAATNIALAVGFNGSLYRSIDAGLNWYHIPLPTDDILYSVSIADQTAIAVGASGTAFLSTDQGQSWTKIDTGTTNTLYGVVVFKQANPSLYNILAVGAAGTIRWSTNGGVSWKSPTYPTTTNDFNSVTLKDSRGIIVGSSGVIYRTTNAGQNWTSINSVVTNTLNSVHLFTSFNPIALAVGTSGVILRSTNSGESWTQISSGVTSTLNAVALNATQAVIVGNSGTILQSKNHGQTWDSISAVPYVSYSGVFSRYNTNNFMASGDAGTILTSVDHGLSWQSGLIPQLSLRSTVSFATNHYLATSSEGNILRSLDNAQTWTFPSLPTKNPLYALAYDSNARIAVAVGSVGRILRSTDLGMSWSAVTNISTTLNAVISPANNIFISAGNTGAILRSSNGGVSFSSINSGTSVNLQAIDCSSSTCLIVGSSGAILRSTDSGSSWSAVSSSSTAVLYAVAMGSDKNAVAVGSAGTVLYSSNGGSSWQIATKPSTLALYSAVALDAQRFLIADSSGRIFASPNAGKDWFLTSPPIGKILYGLSPRVASGLGVGNDSSLWYFNP